MEALQNPILSTNPKRENLLTKTTKSLRRSPREIVLYVENLNISERIVDIKNKTKKGKSELD